MTALDRESLERYRAHAREAAREAGALLRSLRAEAASHPDLKGPIDLVTAADRASEDFLVAYFQKHTPTCAIVSEEAGGAIPPHGLAWVMDPLDGTTNFVHGLPYYAVSIALVENQVPVIGVVYVPEFDQTFAAGTGMGATLDDTPLRVTTTSSLAHALVATGFPYDVWINHEDVLASLAAVVTHARGLRRLGAAAIDLAYVAAGIFDAFFELRLKPWDFLAGALIVEEAGGTVSDFTGARLMPFSQSILASNGHLHDELVQLLSSAVAEKRP